MSCRALGVDGGDAAAVAVDDTEPEVVAFDEHVIADREGAAGQSQLLVAESAGGAHVLAGARVEVADVVAALGEHHRPREIPGGPPVGDEPLARSLWGALDVDAVVRLVAGERLLGAAVAELVERGALPRVDLAVVLGQLDREAAVDESAERAAGFELGQLAVIADEHQLAADRRGRVDAAARAAASGPCPLRRRRERTAPAEPGCRGR